MAESEKIRSLREITRLSPTSEEVDTLLTEIDTHNHRAAAVLGAAFVEDALEYAIRHRFRPLSKSALEKLFEYPGPLSSFDAKIRIGFALGLYGEIVRNDLNVIRNIRNGFAHAKKPISFDIPEVIREMKKSMYLRWKDENKLGTYMQIVSTTPKADSLYRYWYAILTKLLAHELFVLGKTADMRLSTVSEMP